MERFEGEEAEAAEFRNWNELFNLFAKAIASEAESHKIRAVIEVAKMSNDAPESILGLAVPMLLGLLESPLQNPSSRLHEASAYCVKCIASRSELANLMGQFGAIPILLRLLPNSEGDFRRVLLKCLRNLVTFWVPNRIIVASQGGAEIIVDMLASTSGESRLILLEILSALALVREVRKSLWNSRRVDLLVEAASRGSTISRTRAAYAIGLLGLVKRARARLAIVDAGAVPVLKQLLAEGDSSMKVVAGNSLGVISSHVDHIRPIAQAGVIPLYADLLRGSNPTGKEVAEDVFCVLAVCEENAVAIVEHLVRILRGDDVGAKAAAADVIWDLSSYKYSSPVLQNSGVIPLLVELLVDESVDVREKVAGAVAQFSLNEANRAVLADSGAIQRLIDMLEDESDEARDNAAEALVNFSSDPLLGEQTSCILENPIFQNMRSIVMQTRAADEYMDMSLPEQFSLDHTL